MFELVNNCNSAYICTFTSLYFYMICINSLIKFNELIKTQKT